MRPHICEHCGKSYSVKHGLRGHIKSVHSNERPHECKYCEKTFSRLVRLRVHEMSIHLKQRPYACEHCGRSFSDKSNLQRHLRTVHSDVGHSASNGNTVAEVALEQESKVQVPS
ncbi:unnamed protein product [Dicrocoelium dendriticum]|nr:unnamed protein product [Dicrocoelium dendriticum]